MDTLEQQVALLEGRVDGHLQALNDIRDAIVSFEQRMDRRFELVEQRFTQVDQRFTLVDQRFGLADNRFMGIDHKLDQLDAKMSRQFMWLVGILVTTLATLTVGVLTR